MGTTDTTTTDEPRPTGVTAEHRKDGPSTSCHNCGASSIYGFNVVDHDHGIHRVLCADCAMDAVEDHAAAAARYVSKCCQADTHPYQADYRRMYDPPPVCVQCDKATELIEVADLHAATVAKGDR